MRMNEGSSARKTRDENNGIVVRVTRARLFDIAKCSRQHFIFVSFVGGFLCVWFSVASTAVVAAIDDHEQHSERG